MIKIKKKLTNVFLINNLETLERNHTKKKQMYLRV